ncbi:hypothetical protein [Sphingomonas sp.]|jgi:hypothetical protein|uniref:hypothetical protein n=1 Tax=Sphingomonas sp. TaxID=28214 RepID=UPI0035C85F31
MTHPPFPEPSSTPAPAAVDRHVRDCARERHVAGTRISTDARGLQHARCRHCGCELTRLPAIRRWYRAGLLGEA